jgi:tetratricopeptide (TPR) repeat protein
MKQNKSLICVSTLGNFPEWYIWLIMLSLVWVVAGCGGASAHVVRGDQLAKIGLHEEALTEYQLAAKEKPADPEVAQRVNQLKKLMAQNANEGGRLAMESKDYPLAIIAFKRAIELDGAQDTYRQNLKQAAAADVSEAQQLVKKGDFEKGISNIKATLNEVPQDATARQALAEAESAWAGKLLETAKHYEQRGLYGNALVTLVKLRTMRGAYEDSAAHENTCREKLIASADYAVRLTPNRVAGRWRAGTDQVISFLRGQKAEKCPIFAWTDGENNRLTVDVALQGVTVAQKSVNSPAQQKYQSGVRKVDNPKHQELKSAIAQRSKHAVELREVLKKDEQDVEKIRQAFADSGPDDDNSELSNRFTAAQKQLADHRAELLREKDQELQLRDELTRTPRKLDEPVFATHTYQVAAITRTASAKVKAVGTRKGKEVIKETFAGLVSVSDTTNPANVKYAVAADPLQFPKTDAELTQEAVTAAVTTIFKRIENHCGRFQQELITGARQASKNALPEATEKYILYLFSTRDQSTPEVAEFLKEHYQLDDVGALLRSPGL